MNKKKKSNIEIYNEKRREIYNEMGHLLVNRENVADLEKKTLNHQLACRCKTNKTKDS